MSHQHGSDQRDILPLFLTLIVIIVITAITIFFATQPSQNTTPIPETQVTNTAMPITFTMESTDIATPITLTKTDIPTLTLIPTSVTSTQFLDNHPTTPTYTYTPPIPLTPEPTATPTNIRGMLWIPGDKNIPSFQIERSPLLSASNSIEARQLCIEKGMILQSEDQWNIAKQQRPNTFIVNNELEEWTITVVDANGILGYLILTKDEQIWRLGLDDDTQNEKNPPSVRCVMED